MRKNKKLRVILTAAATLIASAGAVLFVKRKAVKRHFGIYSLIIAITICGVMMCGAITAYAVPLDTEPDTVIAETDIMDTEPDEVIIGEDVEIDIRDFLNPEREPNQLTPPGNLTLVDDVYGAQADEKQFITVTTKNGNYFYIIIDRSGKQENVYFLNLVDEYDLLQILQGEDAKPPALPPGAVTLTPEVPTGEVPEETPPVEPRQNNNTQLILMVVIIAAIGGGAFYFFKVRKPKQGGTNKSAVKSEFDEFDFDPDEDDLFADNEDADVAEYDGSDTDEDIPDFTVADDTEPDDGGFSFEEESEGK